MYTSAWGIRAKSACLPRRGPFPFASASLGFLVLLLRGPLVSLSLLLSTTALFSALGVGVVVLGVVVLGVEGVVGNGADRFE